MQLGPDDVLVAARVDVDDSASGGDLEQIADTVEHRIREAYPQVRHVFLDPTDATGTEIAAQPTTETAAETAG